MSAKIDIVDRLRAYPPLAGNDGTVLSYASVLIEAADEIERLRAEVKAQRNRIASLKGLIEDEEEA